MPVQQFLLQRQLLWSWKRDELDSVDGSAVHGAAKAERWLVQCWTCLFLVVIKCQVDSTLPLGWFFSLFFSFLYVWTLA